MLPLIIVAQEESPEYSMESKQNGTIQLKKAKAQAY